MKTLILILSLLSFHIYPTGHDAVIAVFNLSQHDNDLSLSIVFDIEDYHTVHNIEKTSITTEHLGQYINESTNWQINGKELELEVESISKENDHYKAICKTIQFREGIKDIDVRNQFLLTIEGHSNIVMLDINDTFRDFRMHKDRKQIQVRF